MRLPSYANNLAQGDAFTFHFNNMESYNLDNLSRSFLSELERCVSITVFSISFADHLVVTIPAKSPEVGDLTVHVNADEVVVHIGQYYHTHFETYTIEAATPGESEKVAAGDAAHFIRDVLEQRVRFRAQFAHGRCLCFSSWYPGKSDGIRRLSGAEEVIEYVWSGRI